MIQGNEWRDLKAETEEIKKETRRTNLTSKPNKAFLERNNKTAGILSNRIKKKKTPQFETAHNYRY